MPVPTAAKRGNSLILSARGRWTAGLVARWWFDRIHGRTASVEPRDPSAPYRVTRFVYRFDGIGYLDDALQNIFIQSIHGGEAQAAHR